MSEIKYDAFISYSHSEPDAYVAEKLHTMLEHYHISKKLQKISGKKKIERVFRDREELPLSSDLAANIREALENSEFLIVVCSPRAVRSEWVQREIETFLETHEKDKVLTLLTEGEPEEVFPEVLCYNDEVVLRENGEKEVVRKKVEPMAADIRGRTRKETEKKLKEEFLRILAPMLSCTYDTLRQRHREYRFRRIIAVTGAAAVLAVMFTVYAFYQASVSEGRYQEARRNQARYLSEISGELLAEGDREGALQTALAIAPEGDAEGPVVPEQMYALNNALYSYDNNNKIKFRPAYSAELDGETSGMYFAGRLNSEETGYFCVDMLGNAYVINPENGECIWKISPGDIQDLEENAGFNSFIPVSEETAAAVSGRSIVYVNWQEKEVLRTIEAEETLTDESNISAVYGTRFALTNGSKVWVYDLENGQLLQETQYSEENGQDYISHSLSFSENGSLLAVGVAADYLDTEVQKGLLVLDVDDGSVRMFSPEETAEVCFIGNDQIAAIQYRYIDRTDRLDEVTKRSYTLSLYDAADGSVIWTSELCDTEAMNNPTGLTVENMEVDGRTEDILVSVVKDRIFLIHPDSGEIFQERSYPEDIDAVSRYDETRLLAGLTDGRVMICLTGQMTTEYEACSITAATSGFVFSQKNDKVILPVTGSRRIVFCGIFQDSNMTGLSMESDISTVEYHTVADGDAEETYRCVIYADPDSIYETELAVYAAGSAEPVYEFSSPEEEEWIVRTDIQDVGGKPYIFILTNSGTQRLTIADMDTGECVSEAGSGEEEVWGAINYTFFHTADQILLYSGDVFAAADITAEGIMFPDKETEGIDMGGFSASEAEISADDRYILFFDQYSENSIKIWDTENRSWKKTDGRQTYPANGAAKMGNSLNIAAVYSRNGTIDIIDLEKGTVVQQLKCGYYDQIEFAFMNEDRYLISCGDESYLTLWDIQTGKILMQEEDSEVYVSSIYTDGNAHYFATAFYGYWMNDNGLYSSELKIYYVDDEGRFYHYADVPYGYVSFEGGEVFSAVPGGFYGSIYSYGDLRSRAEEILDGSTLSEAEKRQYFVSE